MKEKKDCILREFNKLNCDYHEFAEKNLKETNTFCEPTRRGISDAIGHNMMEINGKFREFSKNLDGPENHESLFCTLGIKIETEEILDLLNNLENFKNEEPNHCNRDGNCPETSPCGLKRASEKALRSKHGKKVPILVEELKKNSGNLK